MMKFRAKVRFSGEKSAETLVHAFFKEFNPQSSITIKGREGILEIVFDEPPMTTVEAICHCDMIEFNYGKSQEEVFKSDTEQAMSEKETAEQTEQAVPEEENVEQTEQAVPEEEPVEQTEQAVLEKESVEQTEQIVPVKEPVEQTEQAVPEEKNIEQTEQAVSEEEPVEQTEQTIPVEELTKQTDQQSTIPELSEFAKHATSYKEFIKSIAEWLALGKKQEYFENIVMAAGQAKKITWNNIEAILMSNGLTYSSYEKIWCNKQVTKKFNGTMTFTRLVKEVVSYRTADFHRNVTEAEEVATKSKVKMECMPEIPCFEETLASVDKTPSTLLYLLHIIFQETLASVDKTQPMEERVRYVLTKMGLEEKTEQEKQWILEIANTSVRSKELNVSLSQKESTLEARMTFSQFINDFVKASGFERKVKVVDFLKELQRVVMSEEELLAL